MPLELLQQLGSTDWRSFIFNFGVEGAVENV